MPLHIETPLIASDSLSQAAGRRIRLKLDNLQPSGSFKIRGIGAACKAHARTGKRRFVSSSGGNAGIAVAYAGRCLSVPVVVVVPETTTERARALIRAQGAELVVHGAAWHEAHALAQSLLGEEDAFLHPFDDPLLWQGHATLIDEVAAAGTKPDAIVLSVGGGGLFCGVVEGLRRNGWQDVPIVAAETAGADALARSLAANERIALDAITSIATSLGARQVCKHAFTLAQQHPVRPAVAYGQAGALADAADVLVVVCGGVTATAQQLHQWHAALDANP